MLCCEVDHLCLGRVQARLLLRGITAAMGASHGTFQFCRTFTLLFPNHDEIFETVRNLQQSRAQNARIWAGEINSERQVSFYVGL